MKIVDIEECYALCSCVAIIVNKKITEVSRPGNKSDTLIICFCRIFVVISCQISDTISLL